MKDVKNRDHVRMDDDAANTIVCIYRSRFIPFVEERLRWSFDQLCATIRDIT